MTDNTILMQGKLNKCLEKLHDFSNFSTATHNYGILSLRDFLALNIPLYKNIYIQEYETKKKIGEYRKLGKPKTKYYVYFAGNSALEISKLVYDYLNIPVEE